MDELKEIKLETGGIQCNNYELNDGKGFILIKDVNKYLNLYYFLASGQSLYSFNDIISSKTNMSYTYILIEVLLDGLKRYIFVARPIYTKNEIFGKHKNLFLVILYKYFGLEELKKYQASKYEYNNENFKVIYSGELLYDSSGNLEYNFASGTYMKEKFKHIEDDKISYYALDFENIIRSNFDIGSAQLKFNNNIKNTLLHEELLLEELTEVWYKIKEIDSSLSIYFIDNVDLCKDLIRNPILEARLRTSLRNILRFKIIKDIDIDKVFNNANYLEEILLIVENSLQENQDNKLNYNQILKLKNYLLKYRIYSNRNYILENNENIQRLI